MKSTSKRTRILAAAIAAFIISMFILRMALTGGFAVDVKNINWITDEGVNLSATLFIPKTATNETPAAGILVCPGGNTPHTFYASYSIELARRGYVVLAYDYYGTVSSEMSSEGNSGAIAAMKYLSSLSFVDSSRLGATGHSNGGGQASAAILSSYAAQAKQRSVVFVGCGVSGDDMSVYNGTNVMTIWGKLDECGQGVFWDVVHEDFLNYAAMTQLLSLDSSEIVPGQYYGSAEDSNLRVVYTPNIFHSLSNITPSSVENIINYFDTTLAGNTSTLSSHSFIYLWQELAVLTAAISLCIMLFPAGSILLDSTFFASLKKPLPAARAKADVKFWIFLLCPAILSTLIVKSTIMQGQTILGKLPQIFDVQSTNGFIWWFFLSALIGLGLYFIHLLMDKNIDRQQEVQRAKVSVSTLAKSVLFSLLTVGLPYLCALLAERTTGWYARIFQTYFSTISASRIGQYAVYYVLFAILFSVYAFLQADALRLAGGSEKTTYMLTLVSNALPAVLFLGALYGELIFTHVTPINGREMSRAQGAMMGMLLLYFVISKIVTYFYKKTGNIYVVAAVNAAFVTWLSVNTPQIIV